MAKVLVGRLVGVMNKLIFSNQSNILKGRFLVDGVLDVNELVDLVKKSKNLASFLKLISRKLMTRLVGLF